MDIRTSIGQNFRRYDSSPLFFSTESRCGPTANPTMTTEHSEEEEYLRFIRRVRDGDGRAAEELVRRYEPEIRLEVRTWLRLRDPRLRRVFDSMDICQSVMASFFVRAAIGEYELDEPRQLIRLLVGM